MLIMLYITHIEWRCSDQNQTTPITFRSRVIYIYIYIYIQLLFKTQLGLNTGKNNSAHWYVSLWNFICFMTDKNRVRQLLIRVLKKLVWVRGDRWQVDLHNQEICYLNWSINFIRPIIWRGMWWAGRVECMEWGRDGTGIVVENLVKQFTGKK